MKNFKSIPEPILTKSLHPKYITLGIFDATPTRRLKIADLVITKKDIIGYHVYKATTEKVLIGYDTKSGRQIRKWLLRKNVRGSQDYIDAIEHYWHSTLHGQ